jgi:hypothetical protein
MNCLTHPHADAPAITSEALIRCCRSYAGEIGPSACATLAALPERIVARGVQVRP